MGDAASQRSRSPRTRSLRSRVWSVFSQQQLSEAHHRIAAYLADNAPQSVFLSSPALALAVGVSQPSVTRFARAVGFDGYAELQDHLRALALEGKPGAPSPSWNLYERAVSDAIETLHNLEAVIADPGRIGTVARSLAHSNPLVVLSVRASAPVASYFAYFAARIHPDVRLLNVGGSAAFDGLMQARQAGAEALLCFLMPRYPQEVMSALRYARGLGFRVVVVADRVSRMARDVSSTVLAVGVGSGLIFETYAAPMVAAGILLHAIGEVNPERTRARLADYEQMVATQRVFAGAASGDVPPPPPDRPAASAQARR